MMAAGHGGQILVSAPAAARLSGRPLTDLGEHRLRDLDGTHHLFQVTAPNLRADFPPLHSMGGYVSTLPPQRTSFVGRSQLIGRIHGLVSTDQLVTLVGPGGAGKTRVAIEAAARELPHFADGVFFVDLTQASSDREVVASFLSGIGRLVDPGRGAGGNDRAPPGHEDLAPRRRQLRAPRSTPARDGRRAPARRAPAAARARHEPRAARHRRRAAANLCPPLDADGPTCRPPPGCSPNGRSRPIRGSSSTTGIVRRSPRSSAGSTACRSRSSWPPHGCGRSARRRCSTTSTSASGSSARSTGGSPARQQTLEATIEWSYDLLDDDERRAFRQLAICAGPFTLPIVGGLLELDELDAADRLDSLVAKSLVTPIRSGGTGRGYRLLESLRAFGLAKLDERDEATNVASGARACAPPAAGARRRLELALEPLHVGGRCAGHRRGHDAARSRPERAGRGPPRCRCVHLLLLRLPGRSRLPREPVARRAAVDRTEGRARPDGVAGAERGRALPRAGLLRRYGECFETAERMLADLPPDDPARTWFDAWRIALTTAVAPEVGLALTDDVLARAIVQARVGRDWSVSTLVINKATGLALVREVAEARAVGPAGPRVVRSRQQHPRPGPRRPAVAARPHRWIAEPRVVEALSKQDQTTGAAQFCAAPAALCQHGSTEERAAELVRLSRASDPSVTSPRPTCSPSVGWRSSGASWTGHGAGATSPSCTTAAPRSPSSTSSPTLGRWGDDEWTAERDAAVAHYLSPEHEPEAEEGPAVLDAELARW